MKISDAKAGDMLQYKGGFGGGRYWVIKTSKNPARVHVVYLGKSMTFSRYRLTRADMTPMSIVQETIPLPTILKLLKQNRDPVYPW